MYGETGTRKTTEIGGLVEYIYEKWGLPSRMVTVEPNYSHIMKYVRAEILEVYPVMENFRSPLALLRALSQGAWMPSVTRGEKTYLTPAGPKREFIDPCGNKISQPTLQQPIGAYFFEGISSTASLLLRTVTNAGRKIGEGVVGQFSEESYLEGKPDELYAASAMAHYGFVQNQIQDLLVAFCSLPVKMVAFTAHEGRGVDNITKAPLHGPQVVGKAGTSTIAPKVGDLFHMDSVLATRDASGAIVKAETVRAYFQKHSDPDNSSILWPAKPRWPKDQIAILQK
jgi:hypothetical protein